MRQWMRVAIHPFCRLILALYFCQETLLALIHWNFFPEPRLMDILTGRFRDAGNGSGWDALLLGVSILFGAIRLIRLHPLFNPEHRRWLEAVPWTHFKPLPLGPIHLAWQDAAVMAALAVLALRHPGLSLLLPPLCYILGYLILSAVTFVILRDCLHGFALLYGFGFLLLLSSHGGFAWTGALLVILLYGAAWLGHRRALAHFPWDTACWDRPVKTLFAKTPGARRYLGWPMDRLRENVGLIHFTLWERTLLCGLAGWWVLAFIHTVRMPREIILSMATFLLFLTGFCIVGRLSLYINGFAPPISIAGRLVTFRWIIPGYDQVFVAPLLAIAVMLGVRRLLLIDGVPYSLVLSTAFTLALWIVLCAWPSLRNWRLTGSHRMTAGYYERNAVIKL